MAGGDASGDGPMDLLSDTLKYQLHTSSYTPNQSTNEVKGDLSNEVGNGNGYATGGVTLGSKTCTSSSLVVTFDSADPSWTGTSFTYRYGVLLDDTPTTPADPLILYMDTSGDQVSVGTDLVHQVAVTGWFTLTAA